MGWEVNTFVTHPSWLHCIITQQETMHQVCICKLNNFRGLIKMKIVLCLPYRTVMWPQCYTCNCSTIYPTTVLYFIAWSPVQKLRWQGKLNGEEVPGEKALQRVSNVAKLIVWRLLGEFQMVVRMHSSSN